MTTALHYSLHTSPAPLRAGTEDAPGRATLRITVGNPGPDPVSCGTIALTLPTGEGSEALTATPGTITARTDDAGWSAEHRGDGIFHVRPVAPGTALGPGARIVVTLDDVAVNRAVGTVTLGVGEVGDRGVTGGDGPEGSPHRAGAEALRLVKAAPTAMLEDFRPDRVTVPNGETVTLTWKCDTEPDYEIFFADQRRPVNGFIDAEGNGSWTSPALTTATAFMLLGSTAKDGVPVTYGLTAAVTVDMPDLEVGDLDANGSVRLFGQAQEVDWGTESEPTSYVADTDGLITGYIKTTLDGAPAHLNVFVTPPNLRRQKFATQSWDARGGTDNQEASLIVPVPRGSAVRVIRRGDENFTAALTWFPFGTGPLREPQS
ncbi:hypothetical protein [Streptomyces sp. NPDC090022]|uniref:hypothetical protein n=1 Tax=Streptomyces sp. NPDC090022 TaxID=3365920 RepID=UPI00382A2EEF